MEFKSRALLNGSSRGKYVSHYCASTNLVLLDPGVARTFPDEAAVSETLRLVIQVTEIQRGKRRTDTSARI